MTHLSLLNHDGTREAVNTIPVFQHTKIPEFSIASVSLVCILLTDGFGH